MFILDTDVLSELRKVRAGKAHRNVAAWNDSVALLERKDRTQGAIIRAWLDTRVLPEFEGRILPIDTAVAQRCAILQFPDPRPLRVVFIAATALVHGMTVVTRNSGHFSPMGVKILNPWD